MTTHNTFLMSLIRYALSFIYSLTKFTRCILFVPSWYLPAEYQGKQASANREYLKYKIYSKNFYNFFFLYHDRNFMT